MTTPGTYGISSTRNRYDNNPPPSFLSDYIQESKSWWIWTFFIVQSIQLFIRTYFDYKRNETYNKYTFEDLTTGTSSNRRLL